VNSIPEAIQQLAHADRIILNKVDLFPTQEALLPVITEIRHLNPQAVLITSTQSSVPIEEILNIQSFDVRRYERENKEERTLPVSEGEQEKRRQINITRGVFQIETNSEGKIILPKKKKKQRSGLEVKGEREPEEIVRAEKLDIATSDPSREEEGEGGVSTISLTSKKPINLNQFNRWISSFLKEKGNDIYRFKGQIRSLSPLSLMITLFLSLSQGSWQ
jgi:G3E family GTPase